MRNKSSCILRILQFPQNTKMNLFCYAKYSIKCYAKYKFSKKMLRKIQEILLRKIQISMKIVPQNTAKHLSTSHHDSYDIFRVSNLLDIQQQFYCLIVSLYPRLYVCRQSYCSIVCHCLHPQKFSQITSFFYNCYA